MPLSGSKKRKKTSGLTGLELRMAYQSLSKVKSLLETVTATDEASATDDSQVQESLTFELDFEETVIKLLLMMGSKLDGPQVRRILLTWPASSSLAGSFLLWHESWRPGQVEHHIWWFTRAEKRLQRASGCDWGVRKDRALVFRWAVSSPLCAAKAYSQSGECMRNTYNGSISQVEFIRMKQPPARGLIPFSFAHLQWCHRANDWCSISSTASRLQMSIPSASPPLEVT